MSQHDFTMYEANGSCDPQFQQHHVYSYSILGYRKKNFDTIWYTETIKAKDFRAFIRTYSLLENELLSANIMLLHYTTKVSEEMGEKIMYEHNKVERVKKEVFRSYFKALFSH